MSKSLICRMICLCMTCVLAAGCLSGCGRGTGDGKEKQPEQETKNGFAVTDTAVSEDFSIEDYAGQVRDDLTPIAECRKNYEQEVADLKRSDVPKLHFENCTFRPFPETEDMEVMITLAKDEEGMPKEEALRIIKNWGKSFGIDVDPDQVEEDEDGVFQFFDAGCWCRVANSIGIVNMCDRSLEKYLGNDYSIEDLSVEIGSLEEMKDKKYPLLTGDMTVSEGAEMVLEYFRKGTPFPPAEGVEYRVNQVYICPLTDNAFWYRYRLQRYYHDVPISMAEAGSYQFYGNYILNGTGGCNADVLDHSGVKSFFANFQSQVLHSMAKGNEIISLAKMGQLVSDGLGTTINVDVETVGLTYFNLDFNETEHRPSGDYMEDFLFPCWEIQGKNRVKNENIYIYLDVFTGRIFYYTKR